MNARVDIRSEVQCPQCREKVSVVALPGSNGTRIGWHRRAVKAKCILSGFITCAGSWSVVLP